MFVQPKHSYYTKQLSVYNGVVGYYLGSFRGQDTKCESLIITVAMSHLNTE